MTTYRTVVFVGLLALAGPSPAAAQTGRDSAKAIFERVMTAASAPAGQLAVANGDTIALRATWGKWDDAGLRPVTDTSLFRIGSISKLLTATAAALLWESGRLDLDEPIDRLVPEVVGSHGRVTPRLLGGHLGGIRHYLGRDFTRTPQRWSDVTGALVIFAPDSLTSPPGTRYLYSSYGYNLLGAAVQRAAKADYREVVHTLVTGPLGLRRTHAQRSDSVAAETAAAFMFDGQTARPAAAPDLSDRWPSGGFLSTAEELARFGVTATSPPYLSPRVRDLLFSPMQIDGKSTGVGFGWRVGRDSKGRTVYHHGGASVGGRAMLMVWPAERLAVAMTTNLGGARYGEAEVMSIGEALLP